MMPAKCTCNHICSIVGTFYLNILKEESSCLFKIFVTNYLQASKKLPTGINKYQSVCSYCFNSTTYVGFNEAIHSLFSIKKTNIPTTGPGMSLHIKKYFTLTKEL